MLLFCLTTQAHNNTFVRGQRDVFLGPVPHPELFPTAPGAAPAPAGAIPGTVAGAPAAAPAENDNKPENPEIARTLLLDDIRSSAGVVLRLLETNKVPFENWTNDPKSAIPTLQQLFPNIPGVRASRVQVLIDGLRADPASPEYLKAEAAMTQIVSTLKERQKTLQTTKEKTADLEKDGMVGGVEGFLKNIGKSFEKTKSPWGKVGLIAGLGIGAMFLFGGEDQEVGADGKMHTTLRGKLKNAIFGGLCIWGIDKAYTMGTGNRSMLSQLFGTTPSDKLPDHLSALSKMAGLDSDDQAVELTQLQPLNMRKLYKVAQGDEKTIAGNLGFFHNQVKGADVKKYVQSLVQAAGGKEAFEKKFIVDPKTEGMTFLEVVVDVMNGKENSPLAANLTPELIKESQSRMVEQLRKALPSDMTVEYRAGNTRDVFINGIPMLAQDHISESGSFSHITLTMAGQEKILLPIESSDEQRMKIDLIKTQMQENIAKRVAVRPEFAGKQPELQAGRWIYRQITLGTGSPEDVEIRPVDETQTEWIMNGIVVGRFGAEITNDAVEKIQYVRDVVRAFPIFAGLDIKIHTVVRPSATARDITGTVSGSPFEIHLDSATHAADLRSFNFTDNLFLAKKSEAIGKEVKDTMSELHLLIENSSEGFKWAYNRLVSTMTSSSRGSKNYIYATLNVKSDEVVSNYKNFMHTMQANPPHTATGAIDTAKILADETAFRAQAVNPLKSISRELMNKISAGDSFGSDEFKDYMNKIDAAGYRSQEYVSFSKDFREQVSPPNFDYEGIDKTDAFGAGKTSASIYETVQRVRTNLTSQFSMKAVLTPDEKEYLKFVSAQTVAKLREVAAKDTGILGGTIKNIITVSAINALPSDFGIPRYEAWSAGRLSTAATGPAESPETYTDVSKKGWNIIRSKYAAMMSSPAKNETKLKAALAQYVDTRTNLYTVSFNTELRRISALPTKAEQTRALADLENRVQTEFMAAI